MAFFDECPGAKKFRKPEPEFITCPFCKSEVEIWTDEVKSTCQNCNRVVNRLQDMGCLDWCKYAKECVGDKVYKDYVESKCKILKERLLEELEVYFGSDTKRINHAKKVLGYAEELLQEEKGDWQVVIPASILHDVGIKVAEEKYGSSAGNLQEKEGPEIARGILLKHGFQKENIDQICEIIANHHSPGKINTINFKILYDADWLVNLKDEVDTRDKAKLEKTINKVFLTETGRGFAKKIYLDKKT